MAGTQLKMPSGEPRFTKIKGENRYYDHMAGKSISHRQYWSMRKAETEKTAKVAPAPAAPSNVRAFPKAAETSGGPSLLAQQLLNESAMLGSPVVETPRAPSQLKEIAEDIAEDTKKTVESLAETVTPVVALAAVALGTIFLPEDWAWLAPEQEEAELILEPAARIVLRTFGITGKGLSANGKDALSMVAAMCAFIIGARQRRDDYFNSLESEPYEQPTANYAAAASRGANTGSGQSRPAAPAYDGRASEAHAAPIFGRNTQQAQSGTSPQAGTANTRSGEQPSADKQAGEAAKIRELFAQDYEGRRRLGLAR